MKSCKEIASLLAPGNKLTIMQKVETKMHMIFCSLCSKYDKQLKFLTRAQHNHIDKNFHDNEEKIQELEKKIVEEVIKKTGS